MNKSETITLICSGCGKPFEKNKHNYQVRYRVLQRSFYCLECKKGRYKNGTKRQMYEL